MNRVPPPREQGVVLILTLIVLLIMAIGAVALVRSMNTSLLNAGNLAFRQDLVNQAEQAVSFVIQGLKAGTLITDENINNSGANYSATALATNARGIPKVLLSSDSAFVKAGMKASDLTGANGVTMRYVIDRLCNNTGPATGAGCVQTVVGPSGSQPTDPAGPPAPPSATVYRLSVRVDGPRNTEIFLQTTFTMQD